VNNRPEMSREDRFVERLKAMLPADERVAVGPGDDAAVVRAVAGECVVTTDMLVEGVDFLPDEDPERLGRRALAVNLSDLAAMGAEPDFFLLTIGFAPEKGEEFPLRIARGALARAREFGATLVGGDLSSAPETIVSIALWGRPAFSPILRSGGRAGDRLWLSGWPGRAAAGLRLARRGQPEPRPEDPQRELLDAYFDPEPRVGLGLELARRGLARAAIDLSDGLGVDAGRLARACGLRAVIEKERLPVSPALRMFCESERRDPAEDLLSGGDDYELLFAAPEEAEPVIRDLSTPRVPITCVGTLEEGEGAFLRQAGADLEISGRGYDHLERPG
jgi:thiamine-monophosphate kinase